MSDQFTKRVAERSKIVENMKSYREYVSDERRLKMIDAIISNGGSSTAAAKELGLDESSVRGFIKRLNNDMAKTQSPISALNPNETPAGFAIQRISKHIDKEGNVSGWVIANREKEDQFNALKDAIDGLVMSASGAAKPNKIIPECTNADTMTLYISNDLHFGAMAWAAETRDKDYDLELAKFGLESAIDYLVDRSPASDVAVIADLGDLTEMDDFKNMTPTSGNILDTDGRFQKVLRTAMGAMISMIDKALTKHKIVYFYNIAGNHDITTGYAVMAFVEAWYRNEPRVIVNTEPSPIKYHRHGSTLIGFAHGHAMKMNRAGEVMVSHNKNIWHEIDHSFVHFGHNHKDAVYDGMLAKCESHRNIAPLNAWAAEHGFGRQLGTMKSITYDLKRGEIGRNLFTVQD